jgi:hypothetical protein
MPLGPQAPYDSLATVTQMVRTLLGDYIQNIQSANVGTVNVTGGGLTIVWTSGNQFNALMNGVTVEINGVTNTIALITSPTTATLVNAAALGNNLPYSLVIPTGDIFADSQNYVLPTVNMAWRKLQQKLDHASHPRIRNEVVLFSLPVAGSLDPATQQYINWAGFFNGVTLFTPATLVGCPVLPQDFQSPTELWERQSVGAGVNPLGFKEMSPTVGRLPSRVKGSWNGVWDWREDAIYFIGAILPLDVRISYRAFLADIAVASGGFASTPIPIMRVAEALALYTAGIFVVPRGNAPLGDELMARGDQAVDVLNNRQAKLLQFANVRRRATYVSSSSRRSGRW